MTKFINKLGLVEEKKKKIGETGLDDNTINNKKHLKQLEIQKTQKK